jgi:hypothetical protein
MTAPEPERPISAADDETAQVVLDRRVAFSTEYTLARLHTLRADLDRLARGLGQLADWARVYRPALDYDYLDLMANAAAELADPDAVPDAVRDVAALLPLRGIDYELGQDLL